MRQAVNELGEDLWMDILIFQDAEPMAPLIFNHSRINLIEVSGAGKFDILIFGFRQ